ncbi:PaaI family thioesterase [Jeongeupia sp. USM3]|uniref:PaaI family thioesterase n=1 Tax=Jeongeupia sp. USM3 TaxID=1906741 RepID=UPI00196B7D15|nr:PaaI family thioesterase [Jeongeupia sp. USM3]
MKPPVPWSKPMPDAARAVPSYFPQVMAWFEGLPQCRTLGQARCIGSRQGDARAAVPGGADRQSGNPRRPRRRGDDADRHRERDVAVHAAAGARAIATLDLRIDYLRPAKPDAPIFCTAECYRLTEHIAFTRATAFQDDIAKPVAYAVATFARGTGKEA